MRQVHIADDPTEAHLVKGILEQYGISCEIHGEALWGARGELPLTPETLPTVWIIDEDRFDEAKELIEQFKSKTLTANAGPSWRCPECGVEVEGQFTDCWKCGASRPSDTQSQ
ncbi:MAG: DUF2007 domain-containing protein [Sedimentisphaerales bacterium]|nr:DUF2007 domain-containing protein [Sedimentisphaerales bacterium]